MKTLIAPIVFASLVAAAPAMAQKDPRGADGLDDAYIQSQTLSIAAGGRGVVPDPRAFPRRDRYAAPRYDRRPYFVR